MPSAVPYGTSSRSTAPSSIAARRVHGRRRRSGTPTITCAAPQPIAMKASAANAATVRPAATAPPLPRFADASSASAPMPSASVETPINVVSRPQTMKRMPRKSIFAITAGQPGARRESGGGRTDEDADLDTDRRGVGRLDAKAETGAVRDARRQRQAQRLIDGGVPDATAEVARLGPCLAAAAAVHAGDAHRHLQRDDEAVFRFALRQRDLGAQPIAVRVLAEKRVANAFDDAPRGGKVDGDLVRNTLVRHQSSATERSRSPPWQGNAPMVA